MKHLRNSWFYNVAQAPHILAQEEYEAVAPHEEDPTRFYCLLCEEVRPRSLKQARDHLLQVHEVKSQVLG